MARAPKKNSRVAPDLPALHPVNHDKTAQKLINHIHDRLVFAKTKQERLIGRFTRIDKAYTGYTVLDASDRKRDQDNQAGKKFRPTQFRSPLMAAKLEDLTTFAMGIFYPDTGMFETIAHKNKMDVAKGFSADLNKSADKFNYFSELVKFLNCAWRYNLAGVGVFWDEIYGSKVDLPHGGITELDEQTLIWSGNNIENLDMYNTLMDPTVHPSDVPMYGEFYATVKKCTDFAIRRDEDDGKIYGAHRVLDEFKSGASAGVTFFNEHPTLRGAHEGSGSETDWDDMLSAGTADSFISSIEKIDYYGWLVPEQFNLLPRTEKREPDNQRMAIYHVTIGNMGHILNAVPVQATHGMLPCAFTVPNEDEMYDQVKSYAELLLPFQDFADFLLNLHVAASRKRLYGVVIYDPSKVELGDLEDNASGYVATKHGVFTEDIRKFVFPINDAPDTTGTLQEVGQVLDLMEVIVPTQQARQVADLERATQYQAAATVQASSRKNFKIARVIDDQAFKPLRMQLMMNTYQFRERITILDSNGQEFEIDPQAYRDSQIEFTISDGLKGLDRLSLITLMKDIINTVIQSQQAIQEIDIMALLDYWTSLVGDRTDLSQFRKQLPTIVEFVQALPDEMEVKPLLLEQAMQITNQARAAEPEIPEAAGEPTLSPTDGAL